MDVTATSQEGINQAAVYFTKDDIGILTSPDPIALDQACVDLIYTAPDGQDLIERMESLNRIYNLEHAKRSVLAAVNISWWISLE